MLTQKIRRKRLDEAYLGLRLRPFRFGVEIQYEDGTPTDAIVVKCEKCGHYTWTWGDDCGAVVTCAAELDWTIGVNGQVLYFNCENESVDGTGWDGCGFTRPKRRNMRMFEALDDFHAFALDLAHC